MILQNILDFQWTIQCYTQEDGALHVTIIMNPGKTCWDIYVVESQCWCQCIQWPPTASHDFLMMMYHRPQTMLLMRVLKADINMVFHKVSLYEFHKN
jgi:hypothetical protein